MLLFPSTEPALVSAANRLFSSHGSDGGDDNGRLTAGQTAGIVVAIIVCAVLIAVVVAVVVAVTVYAKRRGCVTQRQPTTPTAAS